MSKILLCSGKKFLCPLSGAILVDYEHHTSISLCDWVEQHYHVAVIKEQPIPQTDIILVTVLDKHNSFPGDIVSFARLSHLLADEPAVIEFLKTIRETMEIQLQYGLHNGTLVSISEIPEEKRGLRCNCVCPGCGGPLIARLGKKKRHHFGHYEAACNLEHAQQTALHILAKDIIEQEKLFAFPSFCVFIEDVGLDDSYRTYNMPRSLEYRKAYTARCSSVVLEKKVSNFVPDIVVEVQGRTCLIEIAVTHFVDDTKQQKINEVGLPVVEVDLSSFLGQQITREAIRNVLISQVNNKKWLYNPLQKAACEWAKMEYEKLYNAALDREEAERQKWLKRSQERAKKEKIREKKREETTDLLVNLFETDNYRCALQQLRSDEKFQTVLQNLHLRKDITAGIPFFFDIPITGEMVFACDRRIWQSALFDKFIYYRRKDENEAVRIDIKKIQACLRDHMDFVPIDWKLVSRSTIILNGREQRFTLFYDVIRKYLDYLRFIGFVSDIYYGSATVECIKSVIPPDKEHSKLLQEALERVDHFAPDVDEQIERFLYPSYISPYSPWYPTLSRVSVVEVESEETIKKRVSDEYETGHLQALEFDFNSSELLYDQYNRRWLQCKICGGIKREDEMTSYGGRGNENKGFCKSCQT